MRFLLALSFLILVGLPPGAAAHEGPPYLALLDAPVGPYEVSLWADPDVGVGTFFVSLGGGPEAVSVELETWPESGRLAPATTAAVARSDGSFAASVPFDRQERWTVRVSVSGARGGGHTQVEVDVTSPGYGRWDLLIYAAPFAAVSLLWAQAALRRVGAQRREEESRSARWTQ